MKIHGRKQYKSLSDAQQVADALNEKNETNGNPVRVEPRQCSSCGYYHIFYKNEKEKENDDIQTDISDEKLSVENCIKFLKGEGYTILSPKKSEALKDLINLLIYK